MSEWRSTQLGNHAEVLSGFPFPSEGFSQEEGVPLIRIRDLLADKVETYFIGPYPDEFVIDDGDILIGMDGDFNIVRWTKGKALLNQRVCKVFTSTAELDNGYLFWLLAPELQNIHQKTPQTTVKHLSVRDLAQLRLEAPPVNEQRLIAHILDTLDTQIQKAEALIAKLEKVKEGLLHDLLTRGIDENGQLRPSPEQAPELYKESPLGLIPREWEYGSLEDVGLSLIDGDRGPNYPSDSELYSTDGFCLFLSAKNVTKTGFKFKESQFITKKKDSLLGNGKLQRDDIVITTRGTVGNFAHYDSSISHDNIRINSGMLIIRNSRSKLSSSFVYTAFKEHYFGIELNAKGSGSAQPQLPARDFKSFSLPAPSFDEQKRTARAAEPLMLKIQSELECQAELKSLKAGLMDDLLTGRVRVTPLLDQAQATTPA